MTRRHFFMGAPLAGAAARSAPAQPARRPNVLVLLADDLGSGDLSSYGCPDIRTPNIDSLAREGVRFTRFYSNGPECTPTRTALLTGRYQQRVGGLECAIGLNNVGRYDDAERLAAKGQLGLPAAEITMARLFRDAGYDTALFGKWHLGYNKQFWPCEHGFEESMGILGGAVDYFTHLEEGRPVFFHNREMAKRGRYLTDEFVYSAIDWLRRPRQRPFFLYLPFTAPHSPIQHPDERDPALGTAPEKPRDRGVYSAMVERMDRGVGELLSTIHRWAEDTIVVFTSDNGADPNGRNEPLRGRKSSLWEGGIRVPCLVRWPRRWKPATECRQTAMTMDLLPTLLRAAGIRPPRRKLDGIDLLSAIDGSRPESPRTLFWRFRRGQVTRKAVRDGDWKLVNDNGVEELHNLQSGELEKQNLLAEESARATQLRARLAAWENEVKAAR